MVGGLKVVTIGFNPFKPFLVVVNFCIGPLVANAEVKAFGSLSKLKIEIFIPYNHNSIQML